MRNKSLLLELLSVTILIIACIIGWFDIPSTLFYIACEVIITTLLIGIFYAITNRSDRFLSIIGVSVFISFIVFFSATIPAIMTDTFHVNGSFYHYIPEYLIEMLSITWPLLVIRIVLGIINLITSNIDPKQKESNLFENLVVTLFTSIGIGLICVCLFKANSYIHTYVVLASLLVARIIALAYMNKTDLKQILNKKSLDS